MADITWQNVAGIESQRFVCWGCSSPLASDKGWWARHDHTGHKEAFICICHRCNLPTLVWRNGDQVPGVRFGNSVSDISDESVAKLYEEARSAMQAGSFTAVVLACRKLLMHIAVSKGAKAGESFVFYVDYLADNNFIPPDARDWVDHIRKRGNEANHEIVIMERADAEELVTFSEMLLKLIFEFPAAIKRRIEPPEDAA